VIENEVLLGSDDVQQVLIEFDERVVELREHCVHESNCADLKTGTVDPQLTLGNFVSAPLVPPPTNPRQTMLSGARTILLQSVGEDELHRTEDRL
jgi:hypothetical protein